MKTIFKENYLISLIKESINEMIIVSCATYIFAKNANGELCILAGMRSKKTKNWRLHNGGQFNVPVGMKDFGETDVECAVREVREETGLNINPSMLKDAGIEEWGICKAGRNFVVMLNSTEETGIGDGENERFIWIPLSQIDSFKWAFGMGNTIKKIAQKI